MPRLPKQTSAGRVVLNRNLRKDVKYFAAQTNTTPNVVRWLFLLFVFSFPFEATDLRFMTGWLSIAKISGLLFFALYFFHYSPFAGKRSFPRVPAAMWWFLGYIAVYVLSGAGMQSEYIRQFLSRILTLVQVIVFFWIASELLKEEQMARAVLLAYTIAAVLFSAAVIIQVPGFHQEVNAGRVTGIGENPNTVAAHMAMALVLTSGLILRKVYKGLKVNLLLASLSLPVLLAMIATGSRGGIAAFVMGTSVYLLPYWKKKRTLAAIGFAALGIIAVGYMIATSPDFLARWQESYYEGKLSERELIFSSALQMVAERPILGWGPVEAGYALGLREGRGEGLDTHNLLLHLLVEVGIVGTIPFLIGLCLCLRRAWQARSGSLGLLPLALMVTIVTANLSGNNLVWKPQWLVLALTIASAPNLTRRLAMPFRGRLEGFPRYASNLRVPSYPPHIRRNRTSLPK